jgi:hypothetical protein
MDDQLEVASRDKRIQSNPQVTRRFPLRHVTPSAPLSQSKPNGLTSVMDPSESRR